MGTDVRPEISKDDPYYISKHRYYELKHFCLQYPEWEQEYTALGELANRSLRMRETPKEEGIRDYTADLAIKRIALKDKMDIVRETCKKTDPYICEYLFKGVAYGKSFTYLHTTLGMPAEKKMYYSRYRKFFYILSHTH